MSNSTSKKKLLLLFAGTLVVLLLILVLAEAGLRFFKYPYKVEWIPTENAVAQFDEELGWAYIPNTSKILRYGVNIRNVHFDKNGIRVSHPEFQFSPELPSVLFIGGSYTMGHGLSYEESFIGQFGAFNGIPYQMVNLGVQAYGSDQALLVLKKYFHKFNTKVVVYTFQKNHIRRNGISDRRLISPNAKFLGTKPLFALNREKNLYLARKALLYEDYTHSYLLDLLKITAGVRLGIFPPHPEELTKAIIWEMNKYCTENGAQFVMLNWRIQESDYNDFQDLNVEIIDDFENAPGNWNYLRIPGDGHPNAEANSYIAQQLFSYFRRRNLL
jgi:hypothetical protein